MDSNTQVKDVTVEMDQELLMYASAMIAMANYDREREMYSGIRTSVYLYPRELQ